MSTDPVRMVMIGGGPGAFIGPIHRIAARLDGAVALVGGVFSSDADRSVVAGRNLGLDPARVHRSIQALLEAEAALPPCVRAEFVAIVTPNDLHADAAIQALKAGFPVLCDKPLARTLAEARSVADVAGKLPVGLTYSYVGYPLVEEARARVAAGAIGQVRQIEVRYTQGWLATPVEEAGNAQAAWRTDPARSGISGCLIDIGVHAQNLAERVTGERIARVCADVRIAVAGRRLDDDAAMLFRTDRDTPGTLIASQVAAGDMNRLELRVYGAHGHIAWAQERPNELWLSDADGPARCIAPHPAQLESAAARALLRVPAGHPEGYLEAFANLYCAFADKVRGRHAMLAVPDANDGVHSLAFVEAALASSAAHGRWTMVEA